MAYKMISATVVKIRIPQKEKVKPYTVISRLMPSTIIEKNLAKKSKPIHPLFYKRFNNAHNAHGGYGRYNEGHAFLRKKSKRRPQEVTEALAQRGQSRKDIQDGCKKLPQKIHQAAQQLKDEIQQGGHAFNKRFYAIPYMPPVIRIFIIT